MRRQTPLIDVTNREAVRLLNGIKDSLERQKNDTNDAEGAVRVIRQFTDAAVHDDTVSVSVDDSPGAIYGESQYDLSVYGSEGVP